MGAGVALDAARAQSYRSGMLDRVLSALEGREQAMLATIERLVRTNSFTTNAAGGTAVAALLTDELCSIPDIAVRRVESASAEFAPHLIASTPLAERAAAGCVALVGHLDTVFPPGTFEGFRVEGGIA